MFKVEVSDYKGRVVRLIKRRAYVVKGSRYITRASLAAVINGKATRVKAGSADPNPRRSWPVRVSKSRIKIGCHVFTGINASILMAWALNNVQ